MDTHEQQNTVPEEPAHLNTSQTEKVEHNSPETHQDQIQQNVEESHSEKSSVTSPKKEEALLEGDKSIEAPIEHTNEKNEADLSVSKDGKSLDLTNRQEEVQVQAEEQAQEQPEQVSKVEDPSIGVSEKVSQREESPHHKDEKSVEISQEAQNVEQKSEADLSHNKSGMNLSMKDQEEKVENILVEEKEEVEANNAQEEPENPSITEAKAETIKEEVVNDTSLNQSRREEEERAGDISVHSKVSQEKEIKASSKQGSQALDNEKEQSQNLDLSIKENEEKIESTPVEENVEEKEEVEPVVKEELETSSRKEIRTETPIKELSKQNSTLSQKEKVESVPALEKEDESDEHENEEEEEIEDKQEEEEEEEEENQDLEEGEEHEQEDEEGEEGEDEEQEEEENQEEEEEEEEEEVVKSVQNGRASTHTQQEKSRENQTKSKKETDKDSNGISSDDDISVSDDDEDDGKVSNVSQGGKKPELLDELKALADSINAYEDDKDEENEAAHIDVNDDNGDFEPLRHLESKSPRRINRQEFKNFYDRFCTGFLNKKEEELNKKRIQKAYDELAAIKQKPEITKRAQTKAYVPILDRTPLLDAKRAYQLQKIKREKEEKLEKELEELTFHPQINPKSKKMRTPNRGPINYGVQPKNPHLYDPNDDPNMFKPKINPLSHHIAQTMKETISHDVVDRLYFMAEVNKNKRDEREKQLAPTFTPTLNRNTYKIARQLVKKNKYETQQNGHYEMEQNQRVMDIYDEILLNDGEIQERPIAQEAPTDLELLDVLKEFNVLLRQNNESPINVHQLGALMKAYADKKKEEKVDSVQKAWHREGEGIDEEDEEQEEHSEEELEQPDHHQEEEEEPESHREAHYVDTNDENNKNAHNTHGSRTYNEGSFQSTSKKQDASQEKPKTSKPQNSSLMSKNPRNKSKNDELVESSVEVSTNQKDHNMSGSIRKETQPNVEHKATQVSRVSEEKTIKTDSRNDVSSKAPVLTSPKSFSQEQNILTEEAKAKNPSKNSTFAKEQNSKSDSKVLEQSQKTTKNPKESQVSEKKSVKNQSGNQSMEQSKTKQQEVGSKNSVNQSISSVKGAQVDSKRSSVKANEIMIKSPDFPAVQVLEKPKTHSVSLDQHSISEQSKITNEHERAKIDNNISFSMNTNDRAEENPPQIASNLLEDLDIEENKDPEIQYIDHESSHEPSSVHEQADKSPQQGSFKKFYFFPADQAQKSEALATGGNLKAMAEQLVRKFKALDAQMKENAKDLNNLISHVSPKNVEPIKEASETKNMKQKDVKGAKPETKTIKNPSKTVQNEKNVNKNGVIGKASKDIKVAAKAPKKAVPSKAH